MTAMEHSVGQAKVSSEQLLDVVTSTNEMAQLSSEVEVILEEFKEQFGKVKAETVVGKLIEELGTGGFAFATSDAEIEDKKGSAIRLAVDNFTVVEGGCLEGTIIRITKNEGTYYLGCRMHEDSKAIEEYVNKKMED